ncbi:MAG: hypothetical protein HC834_03760 [Rhodospirillales bacterium]|nr:hypothetical protein [Rhodospirillales bacterium]
MGTRTKKPSADFVVRMVGSDIRPWAVPLRKLTSAMSAVQRLIEQRDDFAEEEDEAAGKNVPLQLLDIKSGSAAYRVSSAMPAETLSILSTTGHQINSPKSVDWTSATLSSVKELSEVAKALGCVIEFRQPGEGRTLGGVLAKIEPDTYDKVSSAVFVTGDTSVYGKIERVGGKTEMHCGLTVPEQHRMIICKVDGAELTRELGQFMYQFLVVNGMATWVRRGSFLRSMTIRSYDPPKSGSITDALEAVYQAGGSAWDEVDDPDAAITQMRM